MQKKRILKFTIQVTISCPETKYRAEINFLPAGFFGTRHLIEGSIFNEAKSRSKPMMRLKGNWKKVIFIKPKNRSDYQKFTNVAEKDEVAKVDKFLNLGKIFSFAGMRPSDEARGAGKPKALASCYSRTLPG